MKQNALRYLSREEVRGFVQPSDLRGALSVGTSWALIALAFAWVAAAPGAWWAWTLGVLLLGGRQLALAILMHECAHQSLFRSRALNEWVGKWLCAAPIWQRLSDYRTHHLAHHAHTSLEGDPDLGLVRPFPASRRALVRKFARDLTGLTFLRRVLAQLLMDAGVLSYSASTGQRVVVPRPTPARMLRSLLAHTGPVVLTNVLLAAVLSSLGFGYLFAAWALANATVFSAVVRLRAIAEHAATETTEDPFRNTRTTEAHWLARLTVAPHHVNYHLEHHLLPTVPHYRLPALHRLLRARGAYPSAQYAPGYLAVLRLVAAERR
ncbi:MAG: Fatty acid desaturase [Myxococcaceae bacterium]|nr:Fatty acid desaturase [Myxococcaceae bacterium]